MVLAIMFNVCLHWIIFLVLSKVYGVTAGSGSCIAVGTHQVSAVPITFGTVDEYDDDQERYHNYLDGINEVISENCFGDRDLYVMGFHPEDETNDIIETANFDSTVEYLYGMIFVQRLGLLCKASEKLMSKGYYDRDHGNYEVKEIIKKRNQLYRRIINARD